jgi:hypothetical protein
MYLSVERFKCYTWLFCVFGGQLSKTGDYKVGYIMIETAYLQLYSVFKTEFMLWFKSVFFMWSCIKYLDQWGWQRVFVYVCMWDQLLFNMYMWKRAYVLKTIVYGMVVIHTITLTCSLITYHGTYSDYNYVLLLYNHFIWCWIFFFFANSKVIIWWQCFSLC